MHPKDRSRWKSHPIVRAIDANGFYVTHDGGRIAPDVPLDQISEDASIRGNSLLQGTKTRVHPKAVIEDSLCQDAVIDARSMIRDSVLRSSGQPKRHSCDTASRHVVQGGDIRIGSNARIECCHLTNSSVGPGSCLVASIFENCEIGTENTITLAKAVLVHTERAVVIKGPTEVSEAWIGHHVTIDRPGYFEGVFSNEFPILRYDSKTGSLSVQRILDIPHTSRFGPQVIHSTNSGRLFSQPDGIMKDFGPHVGLWHDPLLAHEPIFVGPCCWISSWTKVVGESARVHMDMAEVVQDRLLTYLMPFSVTGYEGESTMGMVFPGESNGGFSHKRRSGAWTFTCCPQAVIQMVDRLYQALGNEEKSIADIVVEASLENALYLIQFWANELGIDVNQPRDQQRGSRGRWFWDCKNRIETHLQSGIWKFRDGKPLGWTRHGQDWHHEKLDQIRQQISLSDGPSNISEEELLAGSQDLANPLENPLGIEEIAEATCRDGMRHAEAEIHPSAIVDPSAQISAGVRVGSNAFIGPGVVLEGNTLIGPDTWLFRTVVRHATVEHRTRLTRCVITGTSEFPATIGRDTVLDGCRVETCRIGDHTIGSGARVIDSQLAGNTTLAMFANIRRVVSHSPAIIGSPMEDCHIGTTLMSMHAAGSIQGMHAQPVTVRVAGRAIEIPAIPMIGGGCQIRGQREAPVVLEGAFLGSNSIIEAGCFVGFGSFVIGRLGPRDGLLPFTVSVGPGPNTDEIGGVLARFPNMIMTHCIGWTYQSLPKDRVHDIIHLVNGQLQRGKEAIRNELDRRHRQVNWDPCGPDACYLSLPFYTEDQLQTGLKIYEASLEQGQWDLVFAGDRLMFANNRGCWLEKNGNVRWQKRPALFAPLQLP